MCGIAGLFHTDGAPVSPVILKRMTDVIAHRGPDGEGHYVDENFGLGHRRLSIIDLSPAGQQPMASQNGRYIIAYNGEIYNYKELRSELQAKGYCFNSKTDSEVVLNALIEWGKDALLRFNGMFAIAFWDKFDRKLMLARDRYGIKPLYYAWIGDTLIFGSEIKAIIASGCFRAEMSKSALLEYMTFQNYFTDQTLIDRAKILPQGSYVEISDRTNGRDPIEYWDYNFTEPEYNIDENECIEELNRLFVQAVSRQLVSDVNVGAYLSGGMDSGSITAVAASQLPYIKSFTCGFDLNSASGVELGFDERPTAEYMSYLFKTEHYEMVLKAGDMERIMPRLGWHIEEPRVGQSYPNFYASKLASKFVKVVLSGAGGDELFAGYPWRYYRAVVNNDFDHYAGKYYQFWQRMLNDDERKRLLEPVWNEVSTINTNEIFKKVFHKHAKNLTRPEDYINHSLYFEAKTFLHGLLVIEDKLSMAHSLETRVPFLDNDLVDFAMKLPARFKLGNLENAIKLNENDIEEKQKQFNRTNDGKLILRKSMGRHIPDSITNRDKQGFSAPDSTWFKGESMEYVRSRILNNNAKIYSYLDKKTVNDLVSDHLTGKTNRRLFIWSLLSLETFLDNYIS